MVVDTAAVIAILLGEPGSERLIRALNEAHPILISAASVLEISIVIDSRRGPAAAASLDLWLAGSPIEIVVVTQKHVEAARDGFRRFGKGRHPAGLNFGDCFSYGLAKSTGDTLLFQGDDFSKTDIVAAV